VKPSKIKVLLVEDFEFDVEAIVRALKDEYEVVDFTNVYTRRDFVKALDDDYDLIISDHKLPDFDSFDAFDLLRASGKDIPFIIISGAITEDRAAQTLKKGAADFLSKNSLARLGSATREALENKRLREAHSKAQQELSDAQERLRLAMESTRVGTWDFWPLENRFSFCPRSAGVLGHQGALEMSSEEFFAIVAPSDLDNLKQSIINPTATLSASADYSVEFRLKERETWIGLKGKAYFDPQGQVQRIIGILMDITEQKRKEDSLRAQTKRSEAANRAKSTFLANMSHEIRTPLGVILGYADLLLNPNDTGKDEQEQYLHRIIKNGQELARLIDDILDLSKVEEGRMEIEKKSFDIFELIHDITTSFQVKLQEKNIELSTSIHPRVPAVVFSDPKRLRQILINIVGNAVKFTEKGGIRLTVDMIQRADQPALLAFKIMDSGIGISESKDLFKPFHQEDASTTRRFGGTGLGLALSKALAHSLGGDVELLESTAGVGSTFLVTVESGRIMSIEPAHSARPTTSASTPVELPLSDMKILVADDSKDNQLLIKRILQRCGASVTTVSDGELAVQEGTSHPYDAILMDMQMPVLDGYSATRKLRDLGVEIPIVALTAHAMQEEMQKSLAAGCTAHLTKPIDKSLLLRTLTTYTEQQRRHS
jgi:signal transduction histidine kinase/PleD family two-component response regulator